MVFSKDDKDSKVSKNRKWAILRGFWVAVPTHTLTLVQLFANVCKNRSMTLSIQIVSSRLLKLVDKEHICNN